MSPTSELATFSRLPRTPLLARCSVCTLEYELVLIPIPVVMAYEYTPRIRSKAKAEREGD